MSILFIEDDVIETMKMQRALTKINVNHNVQEAKNGEEALKLLRENKQHPDIILLDLNMPRINGIEFLKIIKKDKTLYHIPIIILTTSSNKKDLLECYKNGIAGYILKPLKYDEYILKLEKTLAYWSINELI